MNQRRENRRVTAGLGAVAAQDQMVDQLGMAGRQLESDLASHRVAHDVGAGDPECAEQPGDVVCHLLDAVLTCRLVALPASSWVDHDDLMQRSEKRDHVEKEPRVGSETRDQYDRRPVPVHLVVELDVTNLGVRHSHLSSSKCPFVPVTSRRRQGWSHRVGGGCPGRGVLRVRSRAAGLVAWNGRS